MTIRPQVLMIAGAAVLGAVLLSSRGAVQAGKTAGTLAVDLVDGVVSGAVLAVGDKLGIPDTSQQATILQGQADLAAGNYWDASFNLPAGDFLSGVWKRLTQ